MINEPIYLPASKSIGARYLTATYFAGTLPADPVFDDCEDLEVIQNALLNLYSDEQPIDYGETPIDVSASGTALRFVAAACASTPGADFVITGVPRLLERPMTPLLDTLRKAGADIEIQGPEGTGPYRIKGTRLQGGVFEITGSVSSQFVSALMLCSPTWEKGMRLTLIGDVKSKPYIEMTKKVTEAFGIRTTFNGNVIEVDPGRYKDPGNFKVEADWSAASYFYSAALLGEESLDIASLAPAETSLQGDSRLAAIMEKAGIKSVFSSDGVKIYPDGRKPEHIELDMRDNPDLVPALAVAFAFSGIKFRFTGVSTLRLKESDRLSVITEEAAKAGVVMAAGDDSLEWSGEICKAEENLTIEPHGDHRIAMAFALTAFKNSRVVIKDARVVEKSFTQFWQQLPKTGLTCTPGNNGEMVITYGN